MKKLLNLLLAVALMVTLGVACDKDKPEPEPPEFEWPDLPLHDDYYYADSEGTKIPLTAMTTKYYMVFKTADKQAVIDALNERGIATPPIIEEYPLGEAWGVPELTGCSKAIVESGRPLSYEMIPELVYLAPYYKNEFDQEMGITNLLEVRPDGLDKLNSLANKYHFLILGKNQFDRSLYYLACTKQTQGNALEIANLLYEQCRFYATPEFMGLYSN